MFNLRQAYNASLTAAAAGLFVCAPAWSQVQTAAQRLADYTASISSADPAAAAAFLADGEVLTLAEVDFPKAAALKAKAAALKDLKELLSMPWDGAKANQLNQALSIRIDVDKPLSRMGVGPEPEKLLPWIAKYQPAMSPAKKAVVKKAIRQWEIVFGTMTDTHAMSWGQASIGRGLGVGLTKVEWESWTIRERNATIARLMKKDDAFIVYDDAVLNSDQEIMNLETVVHNVKLSGALTPAQLTQLSGKSLKDQVYLLGSFFDGSNIAVSEDLKTKIHAARDSMPKEVLPTQQRVLLGGMLTTAIPTELAGTKAGQKVLDFYAANGPLKIEVRPCDGNYSRFDAVTGTIVLDSETIQQYMRMKGYTADSVMKSREQVAEIAKYMSPMVVYESAHHMQDAWGKKTGVYKPRVQEDEIEAMSLEGLYTSEKMRKDPAYGRILTSSRAFSTYASKKLEIGTEFEASGSKKFATTVRQRYFSGLPSLDAAAAQVQGAVTQELGRRATLPAPEQAELAVSGLSQAEAMEMTPEELAGSVGEIRTAALVKIQRDLSSLGVYTSRYEAADNESRKSRKNLKASANGKTSGPPAL